MPRTYRHGAGRSSPDAGNNIMGITTASAQSEASMLPAYLTSYGLRVDRADRRR